MKIIAHIHTDFPDKFGIPRQSGLVKGLTGQIVFEPEYRNPEIVKGIDDLPISGFCGNFPNPEKNTGRRRLNRRVWAER